MPINKNKRIRRRKNLRFEKKNFLSHSEIKNKRKIKREIKIKEGNLLFNDWSENVINSLVDMMEDN